MELYYVKTAIDEPTYYTYAVVAERGDIVFDAIAKVENEVFSGTNGLYSTLNEAQEVRAIIKRSLSKILPLDLFVVTEVFIRKLPNY